MTREGCPACAHMDAKTLDRFLSLPPGTPGGRGPRSLSRDFGIDRRDLARHQKACLTDERRRRGFEAHPELREEYLRRHRSLFGRAEEIMRRESERGLAGRRGRHVLGA